MPKISQMHRAHVLVAVDVASDMKLCVSLIRIVENMRMSDANDLLCEWFSMTGKTREAARQNCVDSIAFFIRCRPELRDAIMGALDMQTALAVRSARWSQPREEKTQDPS